jgi:hypothetical protein
LWFGAGEEPVPEASSSTPGRVTRRLGAVTVAEQREVRAADPDSNPLAWRSRRSREQRSIASEIVDRQF